MAVINVWLIRPGRASTFTPIDGIAQAWITSVDDTSIRIDVFTGMKIMSLVFSRRYILEFSIKVSNSSFFVIEYSWDQYHWCPLTFIVILGFEVSSIRYKIFIEGRAIKRSITAGRIVQIVSISCPSMRNLWYLFLITIEIIMFSVMIVIRIRMIIEWSWKNNSCSILGDVLS